jgi:DNA-binding NtrC family response regulator
MSSPGTIIEPDQLSADFSAEPPPQQGAAAFMPAAFTLTPGNLAAAVERVERDLISAALERAAGNISETARILGLTRRGLYLKMRRLGLDSIAANV